MVLSNVELKHWTSLKSSFGKGASPQPLSLVVQLMGKMSKLRSRAFCAAEMARDLGRHFRFSASGPGGKMPPSTAARMAAATVRRHGKHIPGILPAEWDDA